MGFFVYYEQESRRGKNFNVPIYIYIYIYIYIFFSFSGIGSLSPKGRWFPFSFHIWSAIPVFSISPHTTTFQCSCSLYFQRMSCLAFVYFATVAWDRIYTILGHVVFRWRVNSEEMFTESREKSICLSKLSILTLRKTTNNLEPLGFHSQDQFFFSKIEPIATTFRFGILQKFCKTLKEGLIWPAKW